MGEIYIRNLTPADRIEVCDNCEQQGVYANGKEVKNDMGEILMWFCYNCHINKRV